MNMTLKKLFEVIGITPKWGNVKINKDDKLPEKSDVIAQNSKKEPN